MGDENQPGCPSELPHLVSAVAMRALSTALVKVGRFRMEISAPTLLYHSVLLASYSDPDLPFECSESAHHHEYVTRTCRCVYVSLLCSIPYAL